MTLHRTWLLGVARYEREALGRTVQYTSPDRWEAESTRENWRVRDVLAHLAATEVVAAALLEEESPAELEEYAKTVEEPELVGLDGFTEWAVGRRRETPPHSLAMEWGRAADLLLIRATKLSEADWASKPVWWFGGEFAGGDFIQLRVADWWVSGSDMLSGAGLPPRLEHPPIFCVNDLAIRLIPYGLEVAGHSFPGMTVEIRLSAVGGGRWHQALDSDAAPPPGKKPDAVISGRGHAFAEVAAGRTDVDLCLYDGIIGLGGQVEIAETVLRSLRISP